MGNILVVMVRLGVSAGRVEVKGHGVMGMKRNNFSSLLMRCGDDLSGSCLITR